MAASPLVNAWVEDGRRLLRALDGAGVEVDFALWSYSDEAGEWRLVIASPLVDREGSRAAFAAISRVMDAIEPPWDLDLTRVMAVGTNDPVIAVLKRHFEDVPGLDFYAMNQMRLDGTYFEGALVYGAPRSSGTGRRRDAVVH